MAKTTLKLFSGGFPDSLKPDWLKNRAAATEASSAPVPTALDTEAGTNSDPTTRGTDPSRANAGHGALGPALKVGQLIAGGRFRIEELLDDTGSMAVVYKATQLSLERLVVLKVLRMRFGGTAAERARLRAHLRKELKAYGKLNHPNIVTVHDTDWTEDGHPWIAMEFLDGRSLRSDMRRKRLYSPEEMLKVAGPVARALSAAHECGVVHNDVKPENIYLLNDKDNTVKLVDFGTAKFFSEVDKSSDQNLGIDTVIGTPAYMSAERHYVHPSGIEDPRSDLYSLGIVEVEMLTGVNPITNNDRALTRKQIASRHAAAKFQKPVAASTELWAVIEPLLRADPDHRTQTAREHVVQLGLVDEGQKGPWRMQPASNAPSASPAGTAHSELKLLRSIRSAALGALSGVILVASSYSALLIRARYSQTRPTAMEARPSVREPSHTQSPGLTEDPALARTTVVAAPPELGEPPPPTPTPQPERSTATPAVPPAPKAQIVPVRPATAPRPQKPAPRRSPHLLEISEESPYARGAR